MWNPKGIQWIILCFICNMNTNLNIVHNLDFLNKNKVAIQLKIYNLVDFMNCGFKTSCQKIAI